jgi:hypothetical protein
MPVVEGYRKHIECTVLIEQGAMLLYTYILQVCTKVVATRLVVEFCDPAILASSPKLALKIYDFPRVEMDDALFGRERVLS